MKRTRRFGGFVAILLILATLSSLTTATTLAEPETPDANVNFVNHIGGAAGTATCNANLCYSFQGREFIVLDSAGTVVGRFQQQHWVYDIVVNSTKLYGATWGGVVVCNLSGNSISCNDADFLPMPEPFFEGDLSFVSDLEGVGTGSSFRIYIAGGENGIWMLNPANGQVVPVPSSSHVYSLARIGNYIAGTDSSWGIYCNNVLSAQEIEEAKQELRDTYQEFLVTVIPQHQRLKVKRELASPQAVDFHTGVNFIDVNNPLSPVNRGSLGVSTATHAALVGNILFVATQTHTKSYIFNISDPAASQIQYEVAFGTGCGYRQLALTPDGTKLIASGYQTVAVNVSNANEGVNIIGIIDNVGGDVGVTNNRVLVATGENGLYHLSLGTSLNIVREPELSGAAMGGVRDGNHLLTAQSCCVAKIDALSNPPKVVAINKTVGRTTHIAVNQNRVYVSAQREVWTMNTNLLDEVRVVLPDFYYSGDLAIGQGKLYTAANDTALIVMNLTDSLRVPVFERTAGTGRGDDLTQTGLFLFLVDTDADTIRSYSISNPSNPTAVGVFNLDSHQVGAYESSILAARTGLKQVAVLRILANGQLENYSPARTINTLCYPNSFAVSQRGDLVAIGTDCGVEIWRRTSEANASPPTFAFWGNADKVSAHRVVFAGNYLFQLSGYDGIYVYSVVQPVLPTNTPLATSTRTPTATRTTTSVPPTSTRTATATPPTQVTPVTPVPGLTPRVWIPLIMR